MIEKATQLKSQSKNYQLESKKYDLEIPSRLITFDLIDDGH